MLVLLLKSFNDGEAVGESADSELSDYHAGPSSQVLDRIGFLGREEKNKVIHFASGTLARWIVGIDELGKIAGGFEGIGHIEGSPEEGYYRDKVDTGVGLSLGSA